jgi:hypothetical protein
MDRNLVAGVPDHHGDERADRRRVRLAESRMTGSFSAFFSAREELALQLDGRSKPLHAATEPQTPSLQRWENEGGSTQGFLRTELDEQFKPAGE